MQSDKLILIKNTTKKHHDISNDYTLPDYIPDVKRLVNTNTQAVLHNVFINHNSVIYEGEVVYSAVLICDDDCIRNVIYSEDFSIEASNDNANSLKCHECVVENSAIRLISSRKLNCKSKIALFSKQTSEVYTTPQFKNLSDPEQELTFEKQYSEYEYMNIVEKVVNSLHASHDIELSKDKEEISAIIYCRVDICLNEQKYLEKKLYLRGEALVSVLYESVNSSYVKTEIKLPFSDIVDDIEVFNGCICKTEVNNIRATVSNNSFGEMKRIELDYSYNIICRTYSALSFKAMNDIYSTAYDTDCTYGTVESFRFNSVILSNLSVEGDYEFDDSDGIVPEIIDCFFSVEDSYVSVAQGKILLNGTLKCDLLLKADRFTHQSYTLSFKYEKNTDDSFCNLYSEHSVTIAGLRADINKNKVYLGAELNLSVMTAESYECRYVASVESKPIEDSDISPMIIYYPDKNDTLWDVAKKFRSSCSDIKKANGISGDSLDGVKVLLLPRKKKTAARSMIL